MPPLPCGAWSVKSCFPEAVAIYALLRVDIVREECRQSKR
jgi:hypothetical protein